MIFGITKEEYFRDLAEMFIARQGQAEEHDPNELWFDVGDINGKDRQSDIDELNELLKKDGWIFEAQIYGMGEGHLWFTEKAMKEIEKIRREHS